MFKGIKWEIEIEPRSCVLLRGLNVSVDHQHINVRAEWHQSITGEWQDPTKYADNHNTIHRLSLVKAESLEASIRSWFIFNDQANKAGGGMISLK